MLKKRSWHNCSAILTSSDATSYEEAPLNTLANSSAETLKELILGPTIVNAVADRAIPG